MENSSALYHTVWDILVAHAGALEEDRVRFVQACLKKDRFRHLTEWRFCGHLGFGGKFWRNDGRLYISCYKEDQTKKTQKIIDKVNVLLAELVPEGGIHGPPS
jgi:hypothetical protein